MAIRLAYDTTEPLVPNGTSRIVKDTLTVRSQYGTVTNQHTVSLPPSRKHIAIECEYLKVSKTLYELV